MKIKLIDISFIFLIIIVIYITTGYSYEKSVKKNNKTYPKIKSPLMYSSEKDIYKMPKTMAASFPMEKTPPPRRISSNLKKVLSTPQNERVENVHANSFGSLDIMMNDIPSQLLV